MLDSCNIICIVNQQICILIQQNTSLVSCIKGNSIQNHIIIISMCKMTSMHSEADLMGNKITINHRTGTGQEKYQREWTGMGIITISNAQYTVWDTVSVQCTQVDL